MANMSLEKIKMPEQKPEVRVTNFSEVATGYTKEQASEEAQRCLQCKNQPCVKGCPVRVNIPGFIGKIAEGDFMASYDMIRETNSLPAICGRVCPQETQCEQYCVRAIKGESVAIGRLERFAADYAMAGGVLDQEPVKIEPNGKRIAIVGSGPAGLTCAGDLAGLGYDVTIFEALHTPGGVLVYGIPEFRLPKALVREEIGSIEKRGVRLETNVVVGRTIALDELLSEFDAAFIGSGAGLPTFMKIPGENCNGVFSANEFLTRVNLMKAYDRENAETPIVVGEHVAVMGGGNVAMDAARCAKRLGAKVVTIVYRRGEQELPARLEEIHHAQEEGIEFMFLAAPVEIVGDERGWVKGMNCIRMELGEPDASGRRRPVVIHGSEFFLPVETAIIAIGQTPNPLIARTTQGLQIQKWGGIIADEPTGKTSKARVYAGGDAVTGAATVILAMGAGKDAAAAIHQELSDTHV